MFKNLNKKGGVFKTSSANAKRKQHIAYQNYLIKKQQMFQQQMFQQQPTTNVPTTTKQRKNQAIRKI